MSSLPTFVFAFVLGWIWGVGGSREGAEMFRLEKAGADMESALLDMLSLSPCHNTAPASVNSLALINWAEGKS